MTSEQRVRGVLFDAGGVLIRPIGGRWNPRYDFESVLQTHLPDIRPESFPEGFEAGERFLMASGTTPSRADYHRVVLRALGVDSPPAELLRELEAPAAGPVVEVFEDVRPVLDQLQAWGVPMSIVSDNWAGMEAGFDRLGIGHYFQGYAVSEVLGCNKPDPRMYAAGRDVLGLEAQDCLFIDDDPELVAAAIDLGYRGVAIHRDGPPPASVVPVITSLPELLPIVAGETPHPETAAR